MEVRYQAQVQNDTVIVSSERKPLDGLRLSQWLQVQLLETVLGEVIIARPYALYGTFANQTARELQSNYTGAPIGSIWLQVDTGAYYRTEGAAGSAPVAYAMPAPTYYPVPPATGGGGTTTSKAKRYINDGWPANSLTGPDGTIWALILDTRTYTGTQAPARNPANGPTQSEYDTWKATATAPYPSMQNFTYWVQPSSSTDTVTFVLKGFTVGSTVKVTLYNYTRAADYPGSTWAFPVRLNNVLNTATVAASGMWQQTFNGVADANGQITVLIGGTERVAAGYRFTAIKAEEQ